MDADPMGSVGATNTVRDNRYPELAAPVKIADEDMYRAKLEHRKLQASATNQPEGAAFAAQRDIPIDPCAAAHPSECR